MSFTRSAHGLANYRLFFGVEHVVYIEGKKECDCCTDEVVLDTEFYSSLLRTLRPHSTFKIKPVGNCDDVVNHLKTSYEAGDKNSFGFVDKDCAGILYSSAFNNLRIVTTRGYSWENDLWSLDTVKMVFSQLSLANQHIVDSVGKTVENGIRRLGVASCLDYASRVHCVSLFKKNGNSCGFAVDSKRGWGVPKRDIARLINIYRATPAYGCPVSKEVIRIARKIPARLAVQGHLLSSLACRVISDRFRKIHTNSTLACTVIMNTAISVFRDRVRACLGADAYDYYARSLAVLI